MIIQLYIPEIKGTECENQITQKLLTINGVDHLSMNLKGKTAKIILDKKKSTPEEVITAINGLGYLVEMIS